jgi:hypothetical protein
MKMARSTAAPPPISPGGLSSIARATLKASPNNMDASVLSGTSSMSAWTRPARGKSRSSRGWVASLRSRRMRGRDLVSRIFFDPDGALVRCLKRPFAPIVRGDGFRSD